MPTLGSVASCLKMLKKEKIEIQSGRGGKIKEIKKEVRKRKKKEVRGRGKRRGREERSG